jgi:hypothetical protein
VNRAREAARDAAAAGAAEVSIPSQSRRDGGDDDLYLGGLDGPEDEPPVAVPERRSVSRPDSTVRDRREIDSDDAENLEARAEDRDDWLPPGVTDLDWAGRAAAGPTSLELDLIPGAYAPGPEPEAEPDPAAPTAVPETAAPQAAAPQVAAPQAAAPQAAAPQAAAPQAAAPQAAAPQAAAPVAPEPEAVAAGVVPGPPIDAQAAYDTEFSEVDLADEPPAQLVPPADAEEVAQLDADVWVIDGRPRYHRSECPQILGRRDIEAVPVNEALELGFTPCGMCEPDTALLTEARQRR